MIAMAGPLLIADISPFPSNIVVGGILVAICGAFLSLAVFVAGIIKRRRNRNKSKFNNE